MRIASSPTISPCCYGVDTPQKSKLIAATYDLKTIKEFIGADSMAYLSMEGMFASIDSHPGKFCAACFDEKYPTALEF